MERFDWRDLRGDDHQPVRCWLDGYWSPELLNAWLTRLSDFERSIFISMIDHSDPADRFGKFLRDHEAASGRGLVVLTGRFQQEFFSGENFQTMLQLPRLWIVGLTPEPWTAAHQLDFVVINKTDFLEVQSLEASTSFWLPKDISQWDTAPSKAEVAEKLRRKAHREYCVIL